MRYEEKMAGDSEEGFLDLKKVYKDLFFSIFVLPLDIVV